MKHLIVKIAYKYLLNNNAFTCCPITTKRRRIDTLLIKVILFTLSINSSILSKDIIFRLESDLRPIGFGGSEAVHGLSYSYMFYNVKSFFGAGMELYYDHTNYNNLPNNQTYNFDDHHIGANIVGSFGRHNTYLSLMNVNINNVQPSYMHIGYGYTLFSSKYIDFLCRAFVKLPMLYTDTEYRSIQYYRVDFPIKIKSGL